MSSNAAASKERHISKAPPAPQQGVQPAIHPAHGVEQAIVAVESPSGEFVLTSPNQDFVPLPVFGRIELSMCADGRFGEYDPLQWPQVFSPRHPHLSVLPTRDATIQAEPALWWTPVLSDFRPVNEGSQFGVLSSPEVNRLRSIGWKLVDAFREYERGHVKDKAVWQMRANLVDTLQRFSFPSTFRDSIRQTAAAQRSVLEGRAYIDFYCTYVPRLERHDAALPASVLVGANFVNGAITQNPDYASRLFALGIPVWLVRTKDRLPADLNIGRQLATSDVKRPQSIVKEKGLFNVLSSWVGIAGDSHLQEIHTRVYNMVNCERHLFINGFIPRPSDSAVSQAAAQAVKATASTSSSTGKITSPVVSREVVRKKPYDRKAQHNAKLKLSPPADHAHLPQIPQVWRDAMANVDLSVTPEDIWGYWYPPPLMVVGPLDSPSRLKNYLWNWFWIRDAWLYCMGNAATVLPTFKLSEWRDWLQQVYREDSHVSDLPSGKTAQRKQAALDHFHQLFDPSVYQPPKDFDSVMWYGRSYVVPPPPAVLRQIAWELCEVAFRADLLQLDMHVVKSPSPDASASFEAHRRELLHSIFPDGHWQRPAELPVTDKGLAATGLYDRVHSLEGLRKLMVRWPMAPGELQKHGDLTRLDSATVIAMEKLMVKCFVQYFYDNTGRPPSVPHMLALYVPASPYH